MGTPFKPLHVKFIAGLIFQDPSVCEKIQKILCRKFGPLDSKSPSWVFNQTDYYEKEMGQNLKRIFLSFEKLIDAQQLPRIKLLTNRIEKKFSYDATHRRVNIDPGYLTLSKLILITTKNFAHRIYVGQGLFEEITLSFRNGSFQAGPLTYPDFRQKSHLDFFNQIRDTYYQQIEKHYGHSRLSQCL